jgi:hypothetical protein
MKSMLMVVLLFSFLVSACGPGQYFGLTSTPTPTNTPTITTAFTPSSTPTKKPTSTPTNTPPLPGLGIKTSEVVSGFSDWDFKFSDIPDVDGNPAQKGISDEGFSSITLVGDPFLLKAELMIDMSREYSSMAREYTLRFLWYTSPGLETIEWYFDSDVVSKGKIEEVFETAKVTVESKHGGTILLITVAPAEIQ